MEIKSKIMVLCFLLFIFVSISSVTANDVNDTQYGNENNELAISSDYSNQELAVADFNNSLMSIDVSGGSFHDFGEAVWYNSEVNLNGDLKRINGESDVILQNGKTVTINGNGHTINGNNLGRAFIVTPGCSLTVNNVKFINCNGNSPSYSASTDGGAILNMGNLILKDCTFENNIATCGGALACDIKATTNIVGTTIFSKNRAIVDGGAIKNYGYSPMTISGKVTFDSNSATYTIDNDGKGGAILNQFSVLTISGEGSFINNQAVWDGGAIFNNDHATLNISGSFTFKNNKAIGNTKTNRLGFGGAINNEDGTMYISGNNNFESNTAYRGGAIDSSINSKTTISGKNTFKNNKAVFQGGAICNQNAFSFLLSGTNLFESNTADAGGAISSYETPVHITGENTFSKNSVIYTGGAIHLGFVKETLIEGHSYFLDNKATSDGNLGGSGGAVFATDGATLNIRGAQFLRNTGIYGGAIHVSNNPINAQYNILYANSAVTGDDIEVYKSQVVSLNNNYWGYQSKPEQKRIHTYPISDISSWVIFQSIIPNEIKQNQEVNLVKFVSNSYKDLNGEMADFAISAVPDFNLVNIHKNIGSSKYTGKTIGSMSVSLVGPDFNVNKIVNVVEGKVRTQLKGNNVVLSDSSESAHFEVILSDVNGKLLSGKSVTITVDDKKYTKTTDSNGKAYLTLSGLSNGYHNVESLYAGENKYYDSSTTNGIICAFNNESTTQLQTRDIEMYFKDSTRYKVKLMDSSGKALANKEIFISISGIIYTKTTNENGEASIAINLNSGTHDVMACFPGDDRNEFAFVENTIIVKPTISGNDITKHYKNGTQYYAKFVGKDGKALTNTKIKYNINGVFYERTTDANGYAKMNINLIPGRYVITATNPVNGEMYSNIVTVLTIFEGKDVVKYYRNDTQYIVKILGDDGKPKSGVTVSFNINGVFYNRVTNESGYAKMNLNLIPGDYIITAEYNGLRYSNNIKILPVLSARDVTMSYRDGTKFEVKVLDGQGNAYPNQNITFNINGVFYQKVTDDDGYARLNINLMPGEYIITSEYGTARIANKINIR